MRETIIKNYKHNKALAEGKFEESDFNFSLGSGGKSEMGEMSPERKQLVISDAKERLRKLVKKFPWLEGKEEKKEEPKKNVLDKVKENKNKKSKK